MTIFGAGGSGGGKGKGGGGGRTASEAKDNLDSTAYAKIIELLSEGEIEGFATPSRLGLTQGTDAYMNASMKDVFFNKTPLLRAGASNTAPQEADFNFQNVTLASRFGTQAQTYVPGFDAVEEELAVGANVVEGAPITRTIVDTNVNAVRLTINVPSLQEIKDNGDIIGAEINLQISVQYNSGGYTTIIDDRIVGRTPELYQRDYIVNITGAFPVDIRVTRVTPDSPSAKLNNACSWFSYTELIYQKLRYPNSAYVALRIDAEQFNSIPSRAYRIRGIKVAIPVNATVDQATGRLTYSGVWNGTFGAAKWTSDPAWILWDLLTSGRYGLGDHIQAASLDKWAFFRASQYCNELVPTGLNSPATEPRFSCNVNIQTQEEAYKVINDMCSVFRAMPYWAAGSLTVTQDRPADSAALFSLANVTEAGFSYESSSLKTRATVAIVGWLNLEIGDIDREVVEDVESIAKYGVVTKEISAFACTSRAQAHRIGEWLLYTERYEGEVVSFTASLDAGIVVRPGAIIDIADPVKAGVRRAGRVSQATATVVTVDNTTDIAASGSLSVVLPDAAVETRTISSVIGNQITVSSAYSSVPQNGAMWILDNLSVRPTQWRVLGIREDDEVNYSITAISYNSSKYAFIERGVPLETREISVLNQVPESPIDLQAQEILYVLNGRVASKLALTWKGVRGVNQYRVRWRAIYDNWKEPTVYGPGYDIEDVTTGMYQIEVYAISSTLLLSSAPAALMVNVQGLTGAPSNPTGVSLVPVNESTAIIQWDISPDLDVIVGGEVLIRHDPRQVPTAEWSSSNAIVQAAAGSQTQKQVPLLGGTYFVAFRDQSGVRSLAPVAVRALLPAPQARLGIKTWAEETETPKFNGTNTNLPYNASYNGLLLNPSTIGGSLEYRWFATDGSTPTTKAGFDALFAGVPSGTGIHTTVINWTELTQPSYLPANAFAWEVSGLIIIPTTGNYRFRTTSDDGNELQIDGQIVTSFYGGRGTGSDTSSTIALSAGQYPFKYRMQEGSGGQAAKVEWELPSSGTFVVIPVANYIIEGTKSFKGEYIYEDTLDLGQVYDLNLRRRVVSFPVTFGVLFNSVPGLFNDQPGDFDGASLDQVNAVTYVRTTNDNPTGTPTWSDWNEYVNAIVRCRGIQLKVVAESRTTQVGMVVSELGAVAQLQQRVESGARSGSSSYTVTYTSAFYQAANVAISSSDMGTGDFFTVTSQTRTGFTVSFFNSSNTAVTRTCTYTATGFGREIV